MKRNPETLNLVEGSEGFRLPHVAPFHVGETEAQRREKINFRTTQWVDDTVDKPGLESRSPKYTLCHISLTFLEKRTKTHINKHRSQIVVSSPHQPCILCNHSQRKNNEDDRYTVLLPHCKFPPRDSSF